MKVCKFQGLFIAEQLPFSILYNVLVHPVLLRQKPRIGGCQNNGTYDQGMNPDGSGHGQDGKQADGLIDRNGS